MTARAAIGVGCRRGHPAEAIVALIERTLADWPAGMAMPATRVLATIEAKRKEAGILEAADILGLPLLFMSAQALKAVDTKVETPSAAARSHFGVASVCEGAALAAAGAGSQLVVRRREDRGATCAIAAVLERETA